MIKIKLNDNFFTKHKYLTFLLSGIIFSVPFFLPELGLISWFSLIPFFYTLFYIAKCIGNIKLVELMRYFFVFGMSFYLMVYIWFLWLYPMDFTGLTNAQGLLVAVAAWVGFPILEIVPFMIVPICFFVLRKTKIVYYPLILATSYVIMEWVQSWFLTGLTWTNLAVSQYKNILLIQSVSVFGSYFIGFLIIFVNSLIAVYMFEKRHGNTVYAQATTVKRNMLCFFAIACFFLNAYFGLTKVMIFELLSEEPEEKVAVTIVQGNFSVYEKWGDNGLDNSVQTYIDMTIQAKERDNSILYVFPESAVPTYIHSYNLYEYFDNFAKMHGISVITGCFTEKENNAEYNSLVAFSNRNLKNNEYNKRHLVPFGEYLPMRKLLTATIPFLKNIAMIDTDLTSGKSPNIIEIENIKIGGLICFDSIFPELSRHSTKDGANLLVVSTNDSWYRDSSGIYQHNAQSVIRAVENSRYVVRAANTGISSFINPLGEIMQQTKVNERVYISQEVGLRESNTVYTIFGDICVYFSLFYIAFLILNYKLRRINRTLCI